LKRFAEGDAKWRDINYNKTPFIRINPDGEPYERAENPDNWTFLWK